MVAATSKWCEMSPWFATSYSSIPQWVSRASKITNRSPYGSRRKSGTPTSMTNAPPGSSWPATFRKQATWAAWVVRFMIVL